MTIGEFVSFLVYPILSVRLYVVGKVLPGFKPKKDDLVIDLGSGDKPFWRADVYLDKSSYGNEQRYSSSGVEKRMGLFVDSDIHKTPFKKNTFDFSYCSHVLEHVERPDLAIKEITRISKSGYIEVPNGVDEMLCPHQSHLWFVFIENGELVFIRKSKSLDEVLKNNGSKNLYLALLLKFPFIHFYWKNKIKFRIANDILPSKKFNTDPRARSVQSQEIQSIYVFLTKVLRSIFYKEKSKELDSLKSKIVKAAI